MENFRLIFVRYPDRSVHLTNKKLGICYSRGLPCAQVWDVTDKYEKISGENKSFFEKSENLAIIVKKKSRFENRPKFCEWMSVKNVAILVR